MAGTKKLPALPSAAVGRRVTAEVHLGPMAPADVGGLARLHRQAFPGFFLSTLGEPFLVQFYRGFLQDESAVTVVARDKHGMPRAAVVGTTEPAGFFGRLVRNRWPGFVAASARALLTNPKAAPRLLRAVSYRGDAPAAATGALLSSHFVDPALQAGGVGSLLIDEWARVAASKGAERAFLTTDATDNAAANGFYQARGWLLSDTYSTREGRRMNRYTTTLETL
jgi:ribosomal protein S18 acetylase RimI-like enzyme